MKHKKSWVLLALSIGLFGACSTEKNDLSSVQSDDLLHISFSTAETRAELNENGAGTFSEGDKVGLFIDNGSKIEYRELTYSAGEWKPLLRRSDFGSGKLTLAAHYPARNDAAENPQHTAFTLADDQSAGGFASSDLLFARKEVPAQSSSAEMSFTHALHRLRIRIEGQNVDAPSLRSRMNGSLDLISGEAVASDDNFGWITPRKNSNGEYEAVIFPQTAESYRDEEGLLKIPAAEREIRYKAPEQINGTPLTRFEAGKQLTIRLTLTESGNQPSGDQQWANRKVWVYGITPPEESDWKQLYLDLGYENYYLPWKAEYGWFDCNKVQPNGGEPDGMMCWAATASNLLHWWIAQNKTYVDRYGDRYKGPDYHFPLPKEQESDIFKLFADTFANVAGYGDAGVNWFIHGYSSKTSLPKWDNYNEAGFFKDVFPENVQLSTSIGGLSKERFNETIKDALTNRKGIGVDHGTVRKGHVETIWGVEFDAEGYVSAIYMSDNNDRPDFPRIGCTRYEIIYGTLQGSTATYTAYMLGYSEKNLPITITNMFLVSLGQEYWEQYFAKQGANAEK